MVELEDSGNRRYTAKLSEDKQTLPGSKQIFRYRTHDLLALHRIARRRRIAAMAKLLRPVMIGGELGRTSADCGSARNHAAEGLSRLPAACHSLFEASRRRWRSIEPGARRLCPRKCGKESRNEDCFLRHRHSDRFCFPSGRALYAPGAEKIIPDGREAEPSRREAPHSGGFDYGRHTAKTTPSFAIGRIIVWWIRWAAETGCDTA